MRGKVEQFGQHGIVHGDHPRVCGEKRVDNMRLVLYQGSPPRMRGKGRVRAAMAARRGITPAYAGKRYECSHAWLHVKDHPRVCGEKWTTQHIVASRIGSPPRMRGKAGLVTPHAPCKRITPAYAGKSLRSAACVGAFGDHPRVCGEKKKGVRQSGTRVGSPPRMRGKVSKAPLSGLQVGITPAYAGKSEPKQ